MGVRSGFLGAARRLGAAFRASLRLEDERAEGRDDERRDGEVFVAIGA